jgi:predicted nucleic-acid-binding Zn-ribbon protein
MSENLIEITCARCRHTWYEDLSQLGKADQVIYRGQVERRTYRLRCSRCGTNNVVTVEVEEESHGQSAGG